MGNFRSEIFNLCKKLKNKDEFNKLREVVHELRSKRSEGINDESKMDIALNGIKLNCEFFGILLAFDKQLSAFPLKEKIILTTDELNELMFGQFIISKFIKLCLSDVEKYNENFAKVLNPYSFYKFDINFEKEYEFDLSILQDAVIEFKATKIYSDIINSNILVALKEVPINSIYTLFLTMERDIIKIPLNKVSNEMLALKIREGNSKQTKKINTVDALSLVSFKLLAMREMLKNACHLIYSAILNCDLLVVNEDNLINIEKNESNTIYNYKTILVQDILFNYAKEIVGDIFLFTIDLETLKYHEFGFIRNCTISFSKDCGETTKLSYCILDEELNPIFNLTN